MTFRSFFLASGVVAASMLAGSAALGADEGGGLTIAPHNLRLRGGYLRCLAFSDKRGFPDDAKRAVAEVSVAVTSTEARCHFPELPPGVYAFAFIHDANSDGTLNTNIFGVPTEGYGFSNDASGTFGPPSFKASAVQHDGNTRVLSLKMRY